MTTTAHGLDELKALAGTDVGHTGWLEITQDRINAFANATGDHQWIHVDRERAAAGPFGRTIAPRESAGVGSLIGNIIWIILFGWWLALGHLVTGIALCVTIIGIPLGLANFKIIPISLLPLGVEIVPSDQPYPSYR